MATFNWSDNLSTGNQMIDGDHRHLIDLLNELQAAMVSGKGNAVLGGILDELIAYTVSHFSREELLMKHIHYAEYEMHKAEHEKLIAEVKNFRQRFESGSITVSGAVYTFLSDWLNTHIKTIDKKLGEAAKKAG
jgi:hemerythrin-like metal-binding protein